MHGDPISSNAPRPHGSLRAPVRMVRKGPRAHIRLICARGTLGAPRSHEMCRPPVRTSRSAPRPHVLTYDQ
eukprot:gene20496-biopygen8567